MVNKRGIICSISSGSGAGVYRLHIVAKLYWPKSHKL